MYNEKDDQIFIVLQGDEHPTEFLLTIQPLLMIQNGHVTKEEIRITVETGLQLEPQLYKKTFELLGQGLAITVDVYLDNILRVIEDVKVLTF